MGDCQNYGPFLDPFYNTAANIQGTQKKNDDLPCVCWPDSACQQPQCSPTPDFVACFKAQGLGFRAA